MNMYLKQILSEQNTIIIPGLGALTLTNEKTGEIMFMSYLNHDNGELAGYISEKEGIDLNLAKNEVAKFVREVSAILDQGDTYSIFEFGQFIKNESQEIDFVSWNKLKESSDSIENESDSTQIINEPIKEKGLEPIKEEELEEESIPEEVIPPIEIIEETEIVQPSLDEILAKTEETLSEEKTGIEEVVKSEDPEEKVREVIPPNSEKNIPHPNPSKENSYYSPEELVQIELDKQKQQSEETIQKLEEPKAKKSKGALFWILIVMVLIFVSTLIGTLFFYDSMRSVFTFLPDMKTEKPIEKEETTTTPDESFVDEMYDEDTTQQTNDPEIETITETTVIEETKPTPTVQNKVSTGSFQVIGGSFSSNENAEKMVLKLKNDGIEAKNLGKQGGMFLVSLGEFFSQQEAVDFLKKYGKSGWIKKI
jgi:cell division protein FtsN